MKRKLYFLTAFLLVLTLLFASCAKSKEITGNEFLLKLNSCVSDLQAFSQGVDEVYSLYISNTISDQDFANEVSILQQQFTILESQYSDLKQENPIKAGDNSFAAQKGIMGIETIFQTIRQILNGIYSSEGVILSRDEVATMYIEYNGNIEQALLDYALAYSLISELDSNVTTERSTNK